MWETILPDEHRKLSLYGCLLNLRNKKIVREFDIENLVTKKNPRWKFNNSFYDRIDDVFLLITSSTRALMVHGLGASNSNFNFREIEVPCQRVTIDADFKITKLGPERYIFLLIGKDGNLLGVLNTQKGVWETNDLLQLRGQEFNFDRFFCPEAVFFEDEARNIITIDKGFELVQYNLSERKIQR